jgi:hypothetical protein
MVKKFEIIGTTTGRFSCKGKEKKELLEKIRQFLWDVEHQGTEDVCTRQMSGVGNIHNVHQLRIQFDKVFGNETD